MHSTCTQCMCTCKNAKFNPLKIKKLRAFYKNMKFCTRTVLLGNGSNGHHQNKCKNVKINN